MVPVQVETAPQRGVIPRVAAAQNMVFRAQENRLAAARHEMAREEFGARLLTIDLQQRESEINLKKANLELANMEASQETRRLTIENDERKIRQDMRVQGVEVSQAEKARQDFQNMMETIKDPRFSPVEREGIINRWTTQNQNLITSRLNPGIADEFNGLFSKAQAAKGTLQMEYGQRILSAAAPLSKKLAFASSMADLSSIAESPDFEYAKRDPDFAQAWDKAVEHQQKLELEQVKMAGEQIVGLRKEFNGLQTVKDLRTVDTSFRKIVAGERAGVESPAGDLSMIFNYMKLLDPGSVVRESEFETAANAAPILQRLGISWEKVKAVWAGNKLTPSQRKDFRDQARNVFEAQVLSALPDLQQYNDLAGPGAGFVLNPFDQKLVEAGPDGINSLIKDMSYGGTKDEITDADLQ